MRGSTLHDPGETPVLTLPQALTTSIMSTPGGSTPTADSEYTAGRRTVARAMWIGLWIWPSFSLLDAYMCFVAYPDAPFRLFVLYRVLIQLAFVGAYRASLRGRMELKRLFWLQNITYGAAALAIAMMAVHLGGIRSPYMHGISIVALVRAALVPTHWRQGVSTYARIAFAFPLVMAVGAAVSPAARDEWLSAESLIVFASNYVFVLTSSVIGLITGHIVWSAQEQLYRARRVGRYRLQAPIGKGGMGEVWLAWDQSLQRNVALKILRMGTTSSPEAVRRFELEAQAAGRLRGPHIVRVFDAGASEDGLYYIAMEYLAGMSVASLIEKFGPLPPARAIHLAIQACIALEEAHAAGIIHRDLKPHNLHITHMPDEPDFLKLLDFGIARRLAQGSSAERLTVTGLMIGTPAYLSTELWLGGEADERSDIYAFGVTLHVMLTGVTPFEGWSMARLRAAHLSGETPALRLPRGDALSEHLAALLLRCLAPSADDRVQTVHELHEALRALHDPAAWTSADAEAFWKTAEKARFG
jgi:serine/threonine-protein kinase